MMFTKKTFLFTLCLCLTGLVLAQDPVVVESYDNPGYFITHTGVDEQAEIIQGGDQSLSGKWLLVPGLADPEGISFQSVDNPGYYLRHANWTVWLNEEAATELFQNDATWYIREGLANTAWVSFESINYQGQYLMHNDTLGLVLATPADDELGSATFKIIYDLPISRNPNPANAETDVFRDVVLSWKPGKFAAAHNVYIGTSFSDVDNAGTGSPLLVSPAQDANTYDAGRLELGQTYYWRIDDINAPPSSAVWKGTVWSFMVEPFTYSIDADNISATASSYVADQGPENTINRSGLVGNLHSKEIEDMWLSGPEQLGAAWIQYEFNKPYKLHEMLVWNYNAEDILTFYGLWEVKIEYSTDANTWTQLDSVSEFTPAPGTTNYAYDTTVPFNNVTAKYVRITANSNLSMGLFDQYGLSEVMFMYIPVSARKPDPNNGAADITIDATLNWTPGREAGEHKVYISDDEQSVIDGTAPATTVNKASYNTPTLDLGSTYYWRIDEVNNTETPATWESDIWNFRTQDFLAVDDFESYNDIPEGQGGSHLVYIIWADGVGNNANGSTMGYFEGSSMETDNVHGGEQSVPLFYDNTSASLSEVVANTSNLAVGSNWLKGSPTALVLWIHGDPGNNPATDRLYVKVGSSKVVYDGDISRPQWRQWNINLAGLGINLSNVPTITIGTERIGGSGGSGVILLDDILLYGQAPAGPAEEIWIEAESGTITPPMIIYDDPNASGGKYIMKNPDTAESTDSPPATGSATYTFTVAGGTYIIDCRVITDGNNDSFWVRIPDATMNVAGDPDNPGWIEWNQITVENDWDWEQVWSSSNNDTTVEFTLEAGIHTLEIRYREDESQLDALVITSLD